MIATNHGSVVELPDGKGRTFRMLARTAAVAALGLGLAWSTGALAQETLKIGLILP
jgi:hypothetical protein